MRNPSRTLAFLAAAAATGLYTVGFLWLVPTSPHNEWLLLVMGLLIAGHWMLWRPWRRGVAAEQVPAGSPETTREVVGRFSQDVLSVSTGLYVVGLALAVLR